MISLVSRLRFRKSVVAASILVLSGCAVGPSYRAPEAPVPAHYGESTTRPATTVDLTRWWTTFNDPTLDSLIARATESNLDLKLAAARIREARAQRGVTAADLYPTVAAAGSYTRTRNSKNAFTGGGGGSFPG